MISLDLMKLSEVRIAGDRSNNHTKHFDNSTVFKLVLIAVGLHFS